MKKLISLLCVFALLAALAVPAWGDFDLSGLSYDELVALRDQINLAIWNSEDWQEVTVPQGIWEVGADIPAGKWTIRAASGAMCLIKIGPELLDSGRDVRAKNSEILINQKSVLYKKDSSREEWTIELREGEYVGISSGYAVFSPYAGKPSLGFK